MKGAMNVVMEKCPVCKNDIKATDKACSVCGFSDLHREFITKEDGELWIKQVVEPFRKQYENSKRNIDTPSENSNRKYNQRGLDASGYDAEGYNDKGFNKQGIHRNGSKFDRDGYDKNGFNKYGYDRNGYDKDGYNQYGYDRKGLFCNRFVLLYHEVLIFRISHYKYARGYIKF